jgi:ribonuclease G
MDIFQEDILINHAPTETRVAVVENGVLQEIHIERAASRGRVSSIFKGKVIRVLPGMQAAFVDIGLERAAFIHAADILDEQEITATEVKDITQLVREGQTLIVQVVKDQLGSKGARLTTRLSLASRYLVLLPYSSHLGISQKISDVFERERLQNLLQPLISTQPPLGLIVRTVADGIDESVLVHDFNLLLKLWQSVQANISSTPIGTRIHQDLPLYLRALRDLLRPSVEKIRVDDAQIDREIRAFMAHYMADTPVNVELYTADRPLFDAYHIEDEIQKALQRQVPLKSGGYLVLDQTEAMTTIDVNTGGFVGVNNLQETIFKTNLEASHAIARQLRLRNLGGIIIVDFIDMQDAEQGRQLLRHFEKMLSRDSVKTQISPLSALGLVEMTRKRTRESLERTLCEPCALCQGRGFIKTAESICADIYREIVRDVPIYAASTYRVIAAPAVIDRLLDEEATHITTLAERLQKKIHFQVETLYSQEQFDVVPM